MTLIEAAKLARRWMKHWMENEECDCDGEGGAAHGQCGKTARERELAEIDAAIAKGDETLLQNSELRIALMAVLDEVNDPIRSREARQHARVLMAKIERGAR